jgi:hypothetical protein
MNEERGGGLEQYCLILYIEKTRRQALQHEASGMKFSNDQLASWHLAITEIHARFVSHIVDSTKYTLN